MTAGEIGKDSNVLYAHLGGQPALSAYGTVFCQVARFALTEGCTIAGMNPLSGVLSEAWGMYRAHASRP